MVFAEVVHTAEHSCANKWFIVFNFVAKTQAMWVVWLWRTRKMSYDNKKI